jgi:peptidoglycan/LPS O-acetylase OafA/YrhL
VSRALQWRPLVFVGVASYSIYLYHAPVLESLVRNGWPRPLATAGALAAGILAWALVERYVASKASRSAIEGAIRRAFAWPASLRGRRAAGVLPLP